MKGFLKAMIVVLVLIAAGLAAVMVLGINGVLPNLFSSSARLELANRMAVDAAGITSIDIGYTTDSITFHQGSSNEIIVEEYLSRWTDDMLGTAQVQNGSWTVRSGKRSIFNIGLPFFSSEIRVTLPPGWAGDIAAETKSGSVRSEARLTAGNLSLKSTSGSVHIADAEATGTLTLHTTSGSVKADTLHAGQGASLVSTSGSVKAGSLTAASLTAKSTSGSVRFGSVQAETVSATSSSGSVSFEELNGNFTLKSTSGSVTVEEGTGHGSATATSGGVRITLAALTGNLSMSSTSGSCRLYLPQGTPLQFSGKSSSGSVKTPSDLSWESYVNENDKRVSGSLAKAEYSVEMASTSGNCHLEWR